MTNVIVSTSYRGKSADCYHTTECASVAMIAGKREIPLTEAKARGLTECEHCKGREYIATHSPDFSYYQAAMRAGEAND